MNRFLSTTRWLTHYLLPTIILVGSAVAFYAMGSTPEVPRKPKTAIKATVVEVAEIHALDGPLTIETTGEVVPHRVLSIASEVQGRIVFKHPNLRIGEQVDAGETLIKIDPQRFALTVQRLDITVNQAATTLKQLQQDQANLAEQVWGSRATAPADSAKKSLDDDKRITPVVADVTCNAAGTSHTLHGRLVRQHGAGLDPATRTIACRVLTFLSNHAMTSVRNTLLSLPQ